MWEQVTLDNPDASVVFIAQNANTADKRQEVHASVVERYARMRGFGFVDVLKVFAAAGNPVGWYDGDTIHPSLTGSTAWTAAVLRFLKSTEFPQQQPSTLSTAVKPITRTPTSPTWGSPSGTGRWGVARPLPPRRWCGTARTPTAPS